MDINQVLKGKSIPLGVIILGIVCNIIFDKYYEAKVKNDTKEVLKYIVDKDYDDVDYNQQEFNDEGVDEGFASQIGY